MARARGLNPSWDAKCGARLGMIPVDIRSSITTIGPDRLDDLLYPELGQRLSIEDVLKRIPEVEAVAQVQGEQYLIAAKLSV